MDQTTRWARAAQAGDQQALVKLVEAIQTPVWRLCAHLIDSASADDLAQESLLRVLKALPGFRSDASALTWALAITRYACMDELRRRSRARAPLALDLVDDRSEPDHANSVAADDLLARLDQDRREAFVLTQILGLGYAEAAEVVGCPVGTIRSRVARARADLVAALDDSELATQDPPTPLRRREI